MAVQINYNGSVIADLSAGQTATLNCKDKVMRSNVVVTAPESMGGGSSGGGGGGGGDASLNIAYGDTAPTDTSKLWAKTSPPNKVYIGYEPPLQEVATIATSDVEITELSTTLTQPRIYMKAVAVGEKIYLFGGQSTNNSESILSSIECFDSKTEMCTTLPTTQETGIKEQEGVAVGEKIYLFGGSYHTFNSHSDGIVCFDTITRSISTVCALSDGARRGIAVAEVGGKIYLLGGGANKPTFNTIACYDPSENTYTKLSATLPEVIRSANAIAIGTKIYLFGGNLSSGNTSNIYCYDTVAGEVTTLGINLPFTSSSMKAVMIEDYIFIVAEGKMCSCDWESFEFSEPIGIPSRFYFDVATVKNKIYRFGGMSSNTVYDTIQCIDSGLNVVLENGNIAIIQSEKGSVFPIIATDTIHVQIGIKKVYKGNADNIGEKINVAIYKDGTWTNI